AEANIDMLEPPSLRVNDFSEMGYVDAFDASIDLMRRRYSFTEYKNIDWDQIEATYRPLVVEAEENDDALAFKLAMRNLSYELPDGHVSLGGRGSIELNQFFTEAISGGIGMNIMELDDTRVIVSFILEGSPAEAARISEGDEIVAIDGIPIQEVLDSTFIFGAYSTDEFRRIQELRYAVRRPIGTVMDVTYRNAESGELNTTRMVTVDEVETFNRTSTRVGFPEFVGPVEFELLESGYGYVQISSFNQNEVLTVQDWEYFLTTVKNAGIPGIIVDMRFNGGGSPSLANGLAGYFYEEETIIGYRAVYNEETGEFFVEEENPTIIYPAPEPFRYTGQITLLVGPSCASACETFSYAVSELDNVTVVGQYATAGLGGGVNDFFLPEDLNIRFTVNRGLNADQEIHLEGIGVVPDVRIPFNEETIFAEGDIVLETAIEVLDGTLDVAFNEGAPLGINDEVSGTLNAGERTRHVITGPAAAVDVLVDLDADAGVVIRIYDEAGDELLAEVQRSDFPELPLLDDVVGETLVIEVSTVNDDITADYTITTTSEE
ncbi:MAG: S41 family peptidase, partial [Chloroflexota bacterium]